MTPEKRAYQTEWMRKYRAKDPDKHRRLGREAMKKWAAANPETHRKRVKEWRKANPDKLKVLRRNHKAKRLAVMGKITAAEWKDRLAEFNGCCAYCLRPVANPEMEHMQPLSRGGLNVISNVVPSCQPCNGKKHAKNLLEFAREISSL